MQTSLIQNYRNGDISLIKELLLTVPVFHEIHYFLDNDQFDQLLKCLEVHPVEYLQPFELKSTSAYIFLSTGKSTVIAGILIDKKDRRQNFRRLTRISRTHKSSHIFLKKDAFNLEQQGQSESQKIMTVQVNQLYNESLFYFSNFIGETNYFISNKQKNSALIELNFQKMPQEILNELRQKHNQKLKFFTGQIIFTNVQKYLIENNLSKFYFLKVSFDQNLMKQPSLRTNHIFFLTLGEVEILSNDKKSYLTKAPAIIGVQSVKQVKSVTECCLCYCVQKNEVIEILKKNMEGKYGNSHTEEQLNKLIKSVAMEMSFSKLESSELMMSSRSGQYDERQPRFQRITTTPVSPLANDWNNSSMLKSKQNNILTTVCEKSPKTKTFRIKQQFTNFLHEKYSDFATKKTEMMKKMQNNGSVLYELKTLQSKQPQMSSINKRLKMQRLKKLEKCKQNIILTKQESLNSVNLRIYEEFQDCRVLNKIRRKIDQNISKKKKSKKHWKSVVKNNVSFSPSGFLVPETTDLTVHYS